MTPPLDLSNLPTTLFTEPTDIVKGKSSPVIQEGLLFLINNATKNSTIHFAMYFLDDPDVYQALAKAQGNGVQVNVYLDDGPDRTNASAHKTPGGHHVNTKAREALKNCNLKNVELKPNGLMHAKLVLFSEVLFNGEIVNDVVFVTSSNFTVKSYKKYQDALVFNDATLYKWTIKCFYDPMAKIKKKGTADFGKNYLQQSTLSDNSVAKIYLFPHTQNHHTVHTILKNIDLDKSYINSIKVAVSDWTESRKDILEQLCSIAKANPQKSSIDIIISEKVESLKTNIISKLKDAVRDHKNMSLRLIKENLHSKFILIDAGNYKPDNQPEKMVLCGSENYTGTALSDNCEVMFKFYRIDTHTIYDNYLANWENIYKYSTPGK